MWESYRVRRECGNCFTYCINVLDESPTCGLLSYQQTEASKAQCFQSPANKQAPKVQCFSALPIGRHQKLNVFIAQFCCQTGNSSPLGDNSSNSQRVQSSYLLQLCKQAVGSKPYVAKPRQLVATQGQRRLSDPMMVYKIYHL